MVFIHTLLIRKIELVVSIVYLRLIGQDELGGYTDQDWIRSR
jgi:hypothetical protein